ncbi:S-layer homology domain-containing protein [Paenibacillus sp. strain BS8-2]
MNRQLRKFTSFLMTLVLLLSVFSAAAAADSQSASIQALPADGVYDVPFRYLKDDGSGALSSIHTGYAVEGTGKLTIKEGKTSFSHEMKNIPYFKHVAVLKEGQEKAVITRSGQNTAIIEGDLVRYEAGSSTPIENSAAQSGMVSLTIPNLYEQQVVLLHIEMTTPAYSAWHNVVLQLDVSELPLPEGEFNIPYQYLKDDGSGALSSIHTGYAVEGTGKLTVKEGKTFFSHEMKNIPYFKHVAVLKEGQEKAVITRSGQNTTINEGDLVRYEAGSSTTIENSATQSGTVSLTIPNLNDEQVVLLHIEMTTPAYSAWHNVVLKLDLSALPFVPQEDDGNEQEPPAIVFTDIHAHWAKSDIEKSIARGFVTGYTDGTFQPDATISRSEFAVMISRALGLSINGAPNIPTDYEKIPVWAQPHVARVVTAGIIEGFEDGSFRSEEQLTRAQLAVIIARAARLTLDADSTLTFNDSETVPTWAKNEISAAVAVGLIQGKDGNIFDPNATATRAEALTLIIRLLERK